MEGSEHIKSFSRDRFNARCNVPEETSGTGRQRKGRERSSVNLKVVTTLPTRQ